MLELLKKLEELRCSFLNRDHEILGLADQVSPDMLQSVAGCFIGCATAIDAICKSNSYKLGEEERKQFEEFCQSKKEELGEVEEKEEMTPKDLEAVAALAEEFSKSGDALLRRQASVLDQVLLTFANSDTREAEKQALQNKISEIKKNLGKSSQEENVKLSFKADEVAKVVDKNIKEYKPLEAPLKTRSCIDHPGHQLIRVSDDVYQCSLDKKTYDYKNGFTTLKGNKVPGGDVALQSHTAYNAYVNVPMSFNIKK